MQTFTSKKLTTALLLFALLSSIHTLGQEETQPLQQNEEYKKLIKEFRDLTQRHSELLKKARTDDTSLCRAMDWLENERLEINTPFAQEERDFFSTLQEDDKILYRKWQQGMAAKIHLKVFENEWKKYPESHKALLYWAGILIKQFSKENLSTAPEDNPVPQMSGPENSQWFNFLAYVKKRDASLMEQAPQLAETLHIKQSMIDHFEETAADTALFNVYDTYYRLHYPEEIKNNEKEQKSLRSQLTKINPNWVYKEKIEYPNMDEYKGSNIANAVRSPFSWILMGSGAVLIAIAFIRFYQKRRTLQ